MMHDPDPVAAPPVAPPVDPLADRSPDGAAIDDVARPEQPPMDDDAGLAEDEAETLGDFA